jgi:hypothetical protein
VSASIFNETTTYKTFIYIGFENKICKNLSVAKLQLYSNFFLFEANTIWLPFVTVGDTKNNINDFVPSAHLFNLFILQEVICLVQLVEFIVSLFLPQVHLICSILTWNNTRDLRTQLKYTVYTIRTNWQTTFVETQKQCTDYYKLLCHQLASIK